MPDRQSDSKPVSLYRAEAIEASGQSDAGEPFVALGFTTSILACVALLGAATLVAFAITTDYTRKTRVSGYIEPGAGMVKVHAAAAGQVVKLHVADGTAVNRGDPLLLIDTDHASATDPAARAGVVAQLQRQAQRLDQELSDQARIDELSAHDRERRAAALQAELDQIDREIALLEQRTENAADAHRRARRLAKRGHLPKAAAEPTQAALLDRRTELEGLRRTRLRTESARTSLLADARRAVLEDRRRRSSLTRERDELEQSIISQRAGMSVLVTAPADGIVQGLLVHSGMRTAGEAPLMTIAPAGAALEATLLVPSHAAGLVAAGQAVSLRYAAFPYQRFGIHGGRIHSLSDTLLMPGEKVLPVAQGEPVYLARVTLDRQRIPAGTTSLRLKAGMLLDADVALESRSVMAWLFEPLLGLRERLSPPTAATEAPPETTTGTPT